jgi:hypothetical protein
MTPEQLKGLVEFATEFLYWLDNIDEQKLFHDGTYSPALMHLAQEVLEREGFISFRYFTINKSYWISDADNDYFANGKNKFIAFWEATRQAKGGEQ